MDSDRKHMKITEKIRMDSGSGLNPVLQIETAMRVIKQSFPEFYWVGVYILFGNELRLGPFSGPPTEHVRIPVGHGVCGTAIAEDKNQIVADVSAVTNYLACNIHTKSEIVVLIRDPNDGTAIGQIDIDCTVPNRFGSNEETLLDEIGRILAPAVTALRLNDQG